MDLLLSITFMGVGVAGVALHKPLVWLATKVVPFLENYDDRLGKLCIFGSAVVFMAGAFFLVGVVFDS